MKKEYLYIFVTEFCELSQNLRDKIICIGIAAQSSLQKNIPTPFSS